MKKVLAYIRSRNLVPILIIYYAVGIAGMIIPGTRELFKSLTPISLLMSVLLLFIFHEPKNRQFWLVSLAILLTGYFAEVLGVGTGVIFGEYQYGETLGLKLFHTPLMIGVNWLLLVYCSLYIAGRFIDTLYYRAIIAAILMVVYDFALEPSAINLDMWNWSGGAVPLQNYLGWLLISFGLTYLGGFFKFTARENKLATPLFFIQMGFFVVLDVWFYVTGSWV